MSLVSLGKISIGRIVSAPPVCLPECEGVNAEFPLKGLWEMAERESDIENNLYKFSTFPPRCLTKTDREQNQHVTIILSELITRDCDAELNQTVTHLKVLLNTVLYQRSVQPANTFKSPFRVQMQTHTSEPQHWNAKNRTTLGTTSGEATETEKISKRVFPAAGACWGSSSDFLQSV